MSRPFACPSPVGWTSASFGNAAACGEKRTSYCEEGWSCRTPLLPSPPFRRVWRSVPAVPFSEQPVVSWKSAAFRFRPDCAVPPPRGLLLEKAKRFTARWGRNGGFGGKGSDRMATAGRARQAAKEPYGHRQRSEGFPFPPNKQQLVSTGPRRRGLPLPAKTSRPSWRYALP